MTDQLGQSQVIPYLVGLSKKEFEIHILSAEKKNNFQKRQTYIAELLNSNKINWHSIYYTKKPPIISTLKDISNLKRKAKKLHNIHNFDIIHCRSYIASFVGLYFKKKFGIKFIFDMRGFFADERIDGNIWNIKNPIFYFVYKFIKIKEIQFFQNADYTISLTYEGEKIIRTLENCENIYIKVIPCCADLAHFNYEIIDNNIINNLRKKLNISDNNFIISYLGSIGTWYLLDEMLQFFKLLSKKIENSKFLFITNDNPKEIINSATKIGISENEIIIHSAQREDVPNLLSLSKLSIFFIKPVFSKKASSPTKLAELLGMGIPVICNAGVGDLDNIFSTNNIGILIKYFSENVYNEAIEKLEILQTINKKNIRNVAKTNFSIEIGIEKYYEVYQTIMEK